MRRFQKYSFYLECWIKIPKKIREFSGHILQDIWLDILCNRTIINISLYDINKLSTNITRIRNRSRESLTQVSLLSADFSDEWSTIIRRSITRDSPFQSDNSWRECNRRNCNVRESPNNSRFFHSKISITTEHKLAVGLERSQV